MHHLFVINLTVNFKKKFSWNNVQMIIQNIFDKNEFNKTTYFEKIPRRSLRKDTVFYFSLCSQVFRCAYWRGHFLYDQISSEVWYIRRYQYDGEKPPDSANNTSRRGPKIKIKKNHISFICRFVTCIYNYFDTFLLNQISIFTSMI